MKILLLHLFDKERAMHQQATYNKWVSIWLLVGLVMLVGQIFIGGVTRLTGSGLSITKWEIVTGTLPPMNEGEWEEEFNKYQETPQYKLVNKGMTISAFKYIYFWEYFHRLWARLIGFVFFIPWCYFMLRGWVTKRLNKGLAVVIGFAVLTASFGWIMVASGLVERPWVNAYKLSIHLLLGFSVFITLYAVWYRYIYGYKYVVAKNANLRRWSGVLFGLVLVQVILGGMMSGMKAGLSYPTWPKMNGEWIPGVLFQGDYWTLSNFINYDDTIFMVAWVQLFHRVVAYIILIYSVLFIYRMKKESVNLVINMVLVSVLISQIILGILTLVAFKQGVPVTLGSAHQLGALALSTIAYHYHFILFRKQELREV
jgi:cytochrome c oxidase assembly protein subunit 15